MVSCRRRPVPSCDVYEFRWWVGIPSAILRHPTPIPRRPPSRPSPNWRKGDALAVPLGLWSAFWQDTRSSVDSRSMMPWVAACVTVRPYTVQPQSI